MALQTAVPTVIINAVSIAAAANTTSSAHALDTDTFGMALQVKADNNGTPAANDEITAKVLFSTDGGTTYDSIEHAFTLPLLDTNTDEPATLTVDLSNYVSCSHLKVYAESDASATQAITVTASLREILVPA